MATEVFNIVVKDGDYGNKLVVSGSVFPFFDATTKKMQIGGDTYTLVSKMKDVGIDSLRDLIIGYALMYYNTPYLWGGRSPYGIDCSGLSQIVYRMAGIDLPRDASQQVTLGQNYSFLEEAIAPGDLGFLRRRDRSDHSCRNHLGTKPDHPCFREGTGGQNRPSGNFQRRLETLYP